MRSIACIFDKHQECSGIGFTDEVSAPCACACHVAQVPESKPTDLTVEADAYAESVSVTRRFLGDIYIGRRSFDTVSAAVRAAFVDGYETGRHSK